MRIRRGLVVDTPRLASVSFISVLHTEKGIWPVKSAPVSYEKGSPLGSAGQHKASETRAENSSSRMTVCFKLISFFYIFTCSVGCCDDR